MTKLLVCVDGSAYADNITTHAAWAEKRMDAEIDLLHVLRRHSDYNASSTDHTGAIGIGARSDLMDELVKIDQERAKLDQQKGRLILDHAAEALRKADVQKINTIHRRGSLSETIKEFESAADMIFIGKRGEQANAESEFLGSNLEKVARSVHKPLFLVSSYMRPIHKFLIAYDGKENANKAIEFTCTSNLLKGLECHLITVDQGASIETASAIKKLEEAGYKVVKHTEKDGHVDDVIKAYVEAKEMDLLLMGSYSHSRMRTMLLRSTTAQLIKSCHVPVMVFR
ncbi:MAG: universal stress protein UspA [Alphaproteobacteria bacterium]|nr:MAG: universal stress protein UspA [Alphaproteobacteria bacterium]